RTRVARLGARSAAAPAHAVGPAPARIARRTGAPPGPPARLALLAVLLVAHDPNDQDDEPDEREREQDHASRVAPRARARPRPAPVCRARMESTAERSSANADARPPPPWEPSTQGPAGTDGLPCPKPRVCPRPSWPASSDPESAELDRGRLPEVPAAA